MIHIVTVVVEIAIVIEAGIIIIIFDPLVVDKLAAIHGRYLYRVTLNADISIEHAVHHHRSIAIRDVFARGGHIVVSHNAGTMSAASHLGIAVAVDNTGVPVDLTHQSSYIVLTSHLTAFTKNAAIIYASVSLGKLGNGTSITLNIDIHIFKHQVVDDSVGGSAEKGLGEMFDGMLVTFNDAGKSRHNVGIATGIDI